MFPWLQLMKRRLADGWSGQVIGVHRDCWTCGRTCELCHLQCVRKCRQCSTEYCVHHDDGCTSNEVCCPSYQSGTKLMIGSAPGAVTAGDLRESSSSLLSTATAPVNRPRCCPRHEFSHCVSSITLLHSSARCLSPLEHLHKPTPEPPAWPMSR